MSQKLHFFCDIDLSWSAKTSWQHLSNTFFTCIIYVYKYDIMIANNMYDIMISYHKCTLHITLISPTFLKLISYSSRVIGEFRNREQEKKDNQTDHRRTDRPDHWEVKLPFNFQSYIGSRIWHIEFGATILFVTVSLLAREYIVVCWMFNDGKVYNNLFSAAT